MAITFPLRLERTLLGALETYRRRSCGQCLLLRQARLELAVSDSQLLVGGKLPVGARKVATGVHAPGLPVYLEPGAPGLLGKMRLACQGMEVGALTEPCESRTGRASIMAFRAQLMKGRGVALSGNCLFFPQDWLRVYGRY